MIDKRIGLPKDYLMNFQNDKRIQILQEVGRGASCIVYDANLFDSSGIKHLVRIKELYPVHLPLMRNNDFSFSYREEIVDKILIAKNRFLNAYRKGVELKNMVGLVNSTINSSEIFEFNNTMYIIMSLDEGMDYGKYRDGSLVEMLEHIKSLSLVVKKYHDNGYLHLDIKPENIFVIPETSEHVYLLDFDSVICIEELLDKRMLELSYSEGYAAPEQVQGQIAMMGFHTDIYAIGAVLFSKIFNKHPEIADCRISSTYYFDDMNFATEKYRPKLYRKLSYFFHKTLSISIKNRWSNMNKVIEELEQLIMLANTDEYYLIGNFQYNSANFIGRNEELIEIHDALNENQVIFLSGIGGIGKTELAKRYADEYRDFYDTMEFAFFEQTLEHTVCQEFVINKMCMDDEESEPEYFKRIIGVLKETATEKDLIIIDNFDVDLDENLEILLQCPCKFIFTSRKDFRDYNYKQINIGRIGNLNELMSLYSSYNEHIYDMEEEVYIEKLIEYVDGHTMTVELISKYLRDTEILPSKLFSLFLEKAGVTNTNETLVRQRKDRKMNAESVNRHLLILFDIFNFDELSKEIICTLSLFAGIRIRKDIFINICRIDNCKNKMDKLISNGWIEYNDFSQKISLHQVIQDLIFSNYAPSTESCSHAANGMYDFLCEESASYAERRIKKKVFDIFVERIVGTDIVYARLCSKYGKEDKVKAAISICESIESSESYNLLVNLLLRKIELICQCDDIFDTDMLPEEYIENVLSEVESIFKYALDVCKKEENLSVQCKMLIKLCDRIDTLLSDIYISMCFDSTKGQDKIYQKIVEIYDNVTEKLVELAMVSDEKKELYSIMRAFYSDEDEFISIYRYENYGNAEKAYKYQELIDSLDEYNENQSDVIMINPLAVQLSTVADKCLEEGKYDKAIEYYKKSYEEENEPYEIVARSIAKVYLKKGEVENAICCLEKVLEYDRECEADPDSVGGYTCYICIDLIKILFENNKLDEVKKYACELLAYNEHEIENGDSTSYKIPYIIMAYFYLYDIETDVAMRDTYWKKSKEYFELLKDNELEEILYPFIIEYLRTEIVSNECIVDILDRFEKQSYSSQTKLNLIHVLKAGNVGSNSEQLKIILDLREAELLNEYPYTEIKEAMKCCQEALKYIELSDETNKYLKNKVFSVMAEVMSNDNSFSTEQVDEIKRECDYYLIAEVESVQNDIETEIEIWNNAASQYQYIDKYEEEIRCLQKSEDITLKILNQYDFSKFDRSLWYILGNKIRAYRELKDYKKAKVELQKLHRMMLQYYMQQENADAIHECIYKLKDIAWNYDCINEKESAVDECILALHLAAHHKKNLYTWVEEFSKAVRLQLCVEILKELENLDPEMVDTVIDLKDEVLKYLSKDFEINEEVEHVISVISDKYQHNKIEFKNKISCQNSKY